MIVVAGSTSSASSSSQPIMRRPCSVKKRCIRRVNHACRAWPSAQPLGTHPGPAARTAVPVLHVHLVAADMDVLVGKEFEDLLPDLLAEPQHVVPAQTERRGESLLAPGLGSEAGEPRVVFDGLQEVPRHVDLGNHVDSPCGGVGDDLADVPLRVAAAVERVGPLGPQPLFRQQEVVVQLPARAAVQIVSCLLKCRQAPFPVRSG